MNNWEEEIELIDNLGLLYPEMDYWWCCYDKTRDNVTKAWWIYHLCVYYLNQRIPQLETFIEWHIPSGQWCFYKRHFKIYE